LIDNKNNNTINYFIPVTSEIIYAIEKGELYTGSENYFDNNYIVSAKPIYIDGIINGMICIYYKDDIIENIKTFFEGKTYFENGYPFLVDNKGFVKIHPTLENENILTTKLFEKFSEIKTVDKVSNFQYYYPETNGVLKTAHVKFNKDYNLYIGTTYTQSDYNVKLNKLGVVLIIGVLIASMIIILTFSYFFKSLSLRFNVIENKLFKISIGQKESKFEISNNDELSKINKNTNQIIDYLNNIEKLCIDLKNENYEISDELISENDVITNTIKELKIDLKQRKSKEKIQRRESDIKQWANAGIAKFIDIVRLNNDNINKLSYAVISNVVKYLNAIQGGMYLLKDNNNFLELNSCYAYDKQRIIQKEISIDSGLLGRVVKEKKYLYITEIPDNYMSITSGLGEAPPKFLLICPLIFDNIVLGVIEIASLNNFENYQIEFLEEISESIALTISNLKINQRTELLLRKSQDQSRLVEEQKSEMQKNIQQLQILKDETDKREIEMHNIFKAINSTALVAEFDINGKIITMNDKFLQGINQSKDQIIGKYHKDFTTMNSDSLEYKQLWLDLSKAKPRSIIEAIHFDNTTIWLSQTFTPIQEKDGSVKKILDIAIDITENKLLEKELRSQVREMNKQERALQKELAKIQKQQTEIEEKDNKLNFLLSSIDFSFIRFEFGIQGIILSVNEKFCNILNYNINEIIGRNISEIIFWEEENEFNKLLIKLKSGLVIDKEINLISNHFEYIKHKITFSPIKNDENIVVKILVIGTQTKIDK